MDLISFKKKLIDKVKNYYSHEVIYPVYNKTKQDNVNALIKATQADKDNMKTFIEGKIDEIDAIEALVNALTNTDFLDNSADNIPSDTATKEAYIDSYFPSLTTNEQKDSLDAAIQLIQLGF